MSKKIETKIKKLQKLGYAVEHSSEYTFDVSKDDKHFIFGASQIESWNIDDLIGTMMAYHKCKSLIK